MNATTNEPVVSAEAVRLLLVSAITVSTAFDIWTPTPAQTTALLGLYAAASVVLSLFTRSKVSPSS